MTSYTNNTIAQRQSIALQNRHPKTPSSNIGINLSFLNNQNEYLEANRKKLDEQLEQMNSRDYSKIDEIESN